MSSPRHVPGLPCGRSEVVDEPHPLSRPAALGIATAPSSSSSSSSSSARATIPEPPHQHRPRRWPVAGPSPLGVRALRGAGSGPLGVEAWAREGDRRAPRQMEMQRSVAWVGRLAPRDGCDLGRTERPERSASARSRPAVSCRGGGRLAARDVAAQRGERFGSGFGLARRRLGSRESPGQFGDRRGCAALRCSALLSIRERNLGAGATSRREECAAVLVFESTRRAQRPSAEDMGSGQGMSGARGEVRIS
ncbi:unnamed protein product [Diplocarpon coronariae]